MEKLNISLFQCSKYIQLNGKIEEPKYWGQDLEMLSSFVTFLHVIRHTFYTFTDNMHNKSSYLAIRVQCKVVAIKT